MRPDQQDANNNDELKRVSKIRRNNMFNLSNNTNRTATHKAAKCEECNNVMPQGADYITFREGDHVAHLIKIELCFNCMLNERSPSRQ